MEQVGGYSRISLLIVYKLCMVGHVMHGQGMGHALRAREILVILIVLSREGQ